MGPGPKRYPTRTCVACRTSRQKRDLVRVVRTPGGRVVMDATGRLAGRGAYLCADGSCWRQAVDKGSLQRALGVPLSTELQDQLRAGAGAAVERAGVLISAGTAAGSVRAHELNEGEAVGQE